MSDFDVKAVRVMISDHRAIHGPSPVLDALAAAVVEVEEWRNYRQWCLDPAPDEQHCACVPGLRAEIARLTAALREYADPERWYQIDDDMHPVAPHRAWICPEPMDEWDYARAALEAQP